MSVLTKSELPVELLRRISPTDVGTLGFLLHIMSLLYEKPGHPYYVNADSVIKRRQVEFALLDEYETGHLLVTALWEAAGSYARGLDRAEKIFQSRIFDAEERKSQIRRNRVLTATKNGLVRGGVKLGLICVAIFSTVLTLLQLWPDFFEKVTHGNSSNSWLPAIASAATLAVVSIWLDITKSSSIEEQLNLEYGLERENAHIQRESIRRSELERAWNLFLSDYHRLVGEQGDERDWKMDFVTMTLPGEMGKRDHMVERDRLIDELRESLLTKLLQSVGLKARLKVKKENEDSESEVVQAGK